MATRVELLIGKSDEQKKIMDNPSASSGFYLLIMPIVFTSKNH